jgi:hypothetical protein
MDALRIPAPGGEVILSLRTARSVYAGGGVEEEGRRLRRSSCELEEEEEEEGTYAGGSVVTVTVAIFSFFFLCHFAWVREWLRVRVRVGLLQERMHVEIYICVG